MNLRKPKLTVRLVMLNEVKHLAHEWKVGIAPDGQIWFDAQILRFAQDDSGRVRGLQQRIASSIAA